MKKTILLLLIVFSGGNEAIAQSHPPDCNLQFDHNHDNTICFGYAMARAFGKDKLWPVTNNVYAQPGLGVDINFFETDNTWYESWTVSQLTVLPGSIIVFYNQRQQSGRIPQHASYVDSIASSGGNYQSAYLPAPLERLAGGEMITEDAAYYSTNLDNIIMHQVPNEGGEFEQKTLRQVILDWRGVGPYFKVFTANITKNLPVTYNNDFAGAGGGGKMIFIGRDKDGYGGNKVERDVPLTRSYFWGDKESVEAQSPQTISGNKYEFWRWTVFTRTQSGIQQDLTITQDGNVTAHFTNSTTNTVQVTLIGDGENLEGYLKVGGVVKNLMGTTTLEYSSGNATLEVYPYLVSYGVVYQFSQWSTGSTSTTITAAPNGSYTAYYNFSSVNPPSGFFIASLPGDPGLTLVWNRMVSPYISLLELWSKTKNTSYALLTSLPADATTYTDYRYSISTIPQQNDIGLEYQLKAKYVKPNVRTVWVQTGYFEWVSDDGILPFRIANEPVDATTSANDFAAYPNPFNPSVVLRVQLQEAAHVSLAIYDVTGRAVKQLIVGVFNAGVHDFTWNTQEDGHLPSGVYFAKMDVVALSGRTPQQFVKKLVLSK